MHSRLKKRPAREVVTGRYFGDPPLWRAGVAPECEESRRADETEQAYRMLGFEPRIAGSRNFDLDLARERVARLAPRRYVPKGPTPTSSGDPS